MRPRPDTSAPCGAAEDRGGEGVLLPGPVAEAFLTGAAAAGCTRLGTDPAELNTLSEAQGDEEFLAALDRAVACGLHRSWQRGE